MAQYINETILASYMGQALVTRIAALSGVSLTTTIEQGSDILGSYLRNNGYTVPTTTDPTTITDRTVHAATVAIVWEALASIPELSVPLPEGWETHPCVLARDGILNGSATLSLALNTTTAVGGNEFTSSALTVAEGGSPPLASRLNLITY
jgi:hypothetical protein